MSRLRVLCLLAAFFLPACAQRSGPLQVGAVRTLRLTVRETYAASVVCECAGSNACNAEVMQRVLSEGFKARGIRQVPLHEATRTLTLRCRSIRQAPRNELPLAPGSRLWYQRRIFAPTTARAANKRPSGDAVRIEVTIRPIPAASDNVRPRELRAETTVAMPAANDLKTALDFLIDSLQ